MRKWIVLTAVVVFTSGALEAQRGPRNDRDRGRRGGEQQTLKQALDLSDEQVSRINELRRANSGAVREIFETARENGGKLREEMRKENPDAAVVGRLMVETQSAGKNARAKRDELREQAREVLTEEQASKLDAMEDDPASRRAVWQARAMGLLAAPGQGGRRGFGWNSFGRSPGAGRFGFRGRGFAGRGFQGRGNAPGFQRDGKRPSRGGRRDGRQGGRRGPDRGRGRR